MNPAALSRYEAACAELLRYGGDPMASAREASELAPDWAMPHTFMAWLHLLGTEPDASATALQLLSKAQDLDMSQRERAHWQAAGALANGRWFVASDAVLAINAQHPLDALALQVGHQIDFFTGRQDLLLSRIAAAAPAWSAELSGYHGVLAMWAFGCEENADYERAERFGRQAVEIESRDGWAWHAVAHVMEMQHRSEEGVAWYAKSAVWSHGSFFAVHNHWHWALFHLANGAVDEVLALYDAQLAPTEGALALNLLDASSMLWRLHLRSIDVGDRWEALAKAWEPHAQRSSYAFNDFHAMMAFAMTHRESHANALIAAQDTAMADPTHDNHRFLSQIGHAATLAIRAFARQEFSQTEQLLGSAIANSTAFGGSNAQRDLIFQTFNSAKRSNV